MNVAILGASQNPERTSHQALTRLAAAGHTVFPVHPALEAIDGIRVFRRLADLPAPVGTLTVYVNAAVSDKLKAEILNLRPGRVIFNPGAENPTLQSAVEKAGIPTLEACTLVLLSTGRF